MADGPSFLLIRPADLVVIGVSTRSCTIDAGILRASGDDARITLTFPPQAIAEAKVVAGTPLDAWAATQHLPPHAVDPVAIAALAARAQAYAAGALPFPACLSGVSTLELSVAADAAIPLGVEAFLRAIRTLPLASGRVEMPYGLALEALTTGEAISAAEPSMSPGAADGPRGLWQLALAPEVSAEVRALPQRRDDAAHEFHPLGPDHRAALHGHRVDVTRLRLSALGGTLTTRLRADAVEWDHDLALGRDRLVRVVRRGFLYPFGHPAVLEETAEREFDGHAAILRRRSALRITEPVRAFPADGSSESRKFPFHEVEILSSVENGVVLVADKGGKYRVPDAVGDALREARRIAAEELELATDAFNRFVFPSNVYGLAESEHFDGSAARAWIDAGVRVTEIAAELAKAREQMASDAGSTSRGDGPPRTLGPDDGSIVQTPPPPPPPPPGAGMFQVIQRLEADLAAAQRELEQLHAQAAAELARIDRDFPPSIRGDVDALAVAGLGVAIALREARARIALLDARIADVVVDVPRVSSIQRGGTDVAFQIRCTGRAGAVTFETPLWFVHDVRIPADAYFSGYSSLVDAGFLGKLRGLLPKTKARVPGVPIDFVRRAGPPGPVDVQEAFELEIVGKLVGSGIRPVMDTFKIRLPALRRLVPSLADEVTAYLSEEVLAGLDVPEPIRLSPVEVGFDKLAERGGGILVPTFHADVLSARLGPVDMRWLPGAEDAAAAFQSMKLLGVKLSSLLEHIEHAPRITTLFEDGLPCGVRLAWGGQPLKSAGAFLAHKTGEGADTTRLSLVVEQGAASRSTHCSLTPFSLELPPGPKALLAVDFDSLAFEQSDGNPPRLIVGAFHFEFRGQLELLKELQKQANALPFTFAAASIPDGVRASCSLRLPSAAAGIFAMSGIALGLAVDVPFRAGSPSVTLGFASPESPFRLSVGLFGGGGYIRMSLDASGLKSLEASLEFGGAAAVDLVVARGEVHVLGGVRFVLQGSDVALAAFLRIGGSLSILELVTVSVELRLELQYESLPPRQPRLYGRATLVIAVDLTIYADSVELDSGPWEFVGGEAPAGPATHADRRIPSRTEWLRRQEAFA